MWTDNVCEIERYNELLNNFECLIMIEDADQKLVSACAKSLKEKYGDHIPDIIRDRYESELHNIIANHFASYYVLAAMIAKKSKELGFLHNLRGCAAGSFIVYLLGVSETNPLPPHFYCPECKSVEFVDAREFPSGFDLNRLDVERKYCRNCGRKRVGDGHNIPAEFFTGYDGNKVPDFDINVALEIQQSMVEYLEEVFGKDKTFSAGKKDTVSIKGTELLIEDYCREHGVRINSFERNRISRGFKRNGKLSVGIVVVPNGKDIYDYTPIGYDTDCHPEENIKPATLIEYPELILDKIDILGHTMFSKLKMMEDLTGISAKSIDFSEMNISSFFDNDSFLELLFTGFDNYSFLGLLFTGDFVRKISKVISPVRQFSDLVKIFGFVHGTNVWTDNGEKLAGNTCISEELIAHREDIMLTLMNHGIERSTSFLLAEMVRRGQANRNLTSEQEILLRNHGIPDWYVDSMKRIKYLFPKAHATEYVMNYLRMIWYKKYYPVAFYAAVLSFAITDSVDFSILAEGRKRTELERNKLIEELESDHGFEHWNGENKADAQKEVLDIALECFERGITFLPSDRTISDSTRFIPEGNAIRIPYICTAQMEE